MGFHLLVTAQRSMGVHGFVFWRVPGGKADEGAGWAARSQDESILPASETRQRPRPGAYKGLERGAKRLIPGIHLYSQHTGTQDQLLGQSTDLCIKVALWID